jgi:hypothetical protein
MTDSLVESVINFLFDMFPYSILKQVNPVFEMGCTYRDYDNKKYGSKEITAFFDKFFTLSRNTELVYEKTFYVIVRLIWVYFEKNIRKNRTEFFRLITILQIALEIENLYDRVNYFVRAVLPILCIDTTALSLYKPRVARINVIVDEDPC